MSTKYRKETIIAATATILLFLALIGIVMYDNSNKNLQGDLDEAKLKSESLLSEKLSISKEIDKLKTQMLSLKGLNTELDNYLKEANDKLAKKEAEVKSLRNENATVKNLQKQLADVQSIRRSLEKQVADLNLNIAELNKKNEKFNEMSEALAKLQKENDHLNENAKILGALVAQNYRVESLKRRNDKLTVKSKATKKMVVGFDVPQNQTEDVSFKITSPDGKLLTSDDKSVSYRFINSANDVDETDYYVSLTPMAGDLEVKKRIEMTYKPKEKMVGGIYKIDIYNRDTKLGSCQVRLK